MLNCTLSRASMPPGPYQAKNAMNINDSANPKKAPASVLPNHVGWRFDEFVMNYPLFAAG